MRTIEVRGIHSSSKVLVGESLRNLGGYIEPAASVIVTDTNVNRRYGGQFPPCPVIEVAAGETGKTLDAVRGIYERLIELDAGRDCTIVGIGGGVVCDLTGFVASTFMRGVDFGFVATTLLSQVDAGIGGKNGVNVRGFKNMVGTFNQPRFVICEIDMLKTLPEGELMNGFSEAVKNALIGDAALFGYIEEKYPEALALERDVLGRIVAASVQVKKRIVELDERERGPRKKLNLGHTFGHAIEAVTGVSHGEAVGVGISIAAGISRKRGLIPDTVVDRIRSLLRALNIPLEIECDGDRIMEAIAKDKKREDDTIRFVLLEGIGEVAVCGMSMDALGEIVNDLC